MLPQPELEVIQITNLQQLDKVAIVELCSEAFDEDFETMFELFPGSTHVLARIEGKLVSHACWVTRWLQPSEMQPLRTAYIEAVATAPGYQGQGLGSAVMERTVVEIINDDYELGALSPAAYSFYERLGWVLWRGPTAIRTDKGLLDTPGEEAMVLHLPRTPALDLNALLTAEWREGDLW